MIQIFGADGGIQSILQNKQFKQRFSGRFDHKFNDVGVTDYFYDDVCVDLIIPPGKG